MQRLLAITGAVAGAILACAAGAARAQTVTFDCHGYAKFAERVAEYRDVGAPLPKVLEQIRRRYPPGLILAVLEREARRVYEEKRAIDEAAIDAYRRCTAQLGELESGKES